MATYNGSKYISEQLESILSEMDADDELIVVDDASIDDTVKKIKEICDSRIKLYQNFYNLGHVKSFEKAISLSNNYFIFMADQDDVWLKGRVQLMCSKLISNDLVISSNSEFINGYGFDINPLHIGVSEVNSKCYIGNILRIFAGRGFYFGCAMAFRRDFVAVVLPIPWYVESHDLWIALAANLFRVNLHLDDKTLKRRIHGANSSTANRAFYKKIKSRFIYLMSIIHILHRIIVIKLNQNMSN